MNDYEKKQKRKAYVMFQLRQNNERSRWSERLYFLVLGLMLAGTVFMCLTLLFGG